MFEKKKPIQWKVPALILTSVAVLSGGVYIGMTSIDDSKDNATPTAQLEPKEVFELREDCEIWLSEVYEDGSINEDNSYMLGFAPEELMGKTEDEIINYLNETYPDREVQSLTKTKITLVEKSSETSNLTNQEENTHQPDISKANKYTVENNSGCVAIFKYDQQGNKVVVEETPINIEALPQVAQDEIAKGMIFDTVEEAYTRLEVFQ